VNFQCDFLSLNLRVCSFFFRGSFISIIEGEQRKLSFGYVSYDPKKFTRTVFVASSFLNANLTDAFVEVTFHLILVDKSG